MKKLKTFLLALVLFSLLPLPCLSESSSAEDPMIKMTPAEFQTLIDSVETMREASNEKSRLITSLEASLTELQKDTRKKEIKVGIISFSVGLGVGALAGGITALCLSQ